MTLAGHGACADIEAAVVTVFSRVTSVRKYAIINRPILRMYNGTSLLKKMQKNARDGSLALRNLQGKKK
jgi:hypothetical protein